MPRSVALVDRSQGNTCLYLERAKVASGQVRANARLHGHTYSGITVVFRASSSSGDSTGGSLSMRSVTSDRTCTPTNRSDDEGWQRVQRHQDDVIVSSTRLVAVRECCRHGRTRT